MSHALDPPPPCHKLSHLLGPPTSLERDVLYGRPQLVFSVFLFVYHILNRHRHSANTKSR